MFSKEPSFKYLQNTAYIEDVLYRMTYTNGTDKALASGSCVSVGFPYFVTARHVVEDYLNQIPKTDVQENMVLVKGIPLKAPTINNQHIVLAKATKSGTFISLIVEDVCFPSNNADLALMKVAVGNVIGDNNIPKVLLNLWNPTIGARVVSSGFANSKTSVEWIDDHLNINVNDDLATSVGEINEVFTEKRDAIRMNFPCFQTNMKLAPSMSGGPVFNDAGHLCGINCSSFDFGSNMGDTSYITSLISLIYILNLEGKSLFLQLVKDNIIMVDDKDYFLKEIERQQPSLL